MLPNLTLWFKGLVIGFSIAAPVGPIGVLCMRRTLAQGRVSGLISGLGAATADAIYGCVAGFGLTSVSSFLVDQQGWFRLFGGAFLCFLGVKTLLSKPLTGAESSRETRLLGNYASTFVLTLTNPMTIISFAAIYAGLGGLERGSYLSAGALVTGVFVGSGLWWVTLSTGVGLVRKGVTPVWLRWVNRISGMVLMGFGLFIFLSLAV
jgi:threonine/homoserine/homoserine lactone efflux protein